MDDPDEMSVPDRIWDRALWSDDARLAAGDRSLAAALVLHGMVMNGGLLNAVEALTGPELDAGESGFRWLGLADAGDAIASVRREVAAGRLDDDRMAALEVEADDRYADAVPDDAALIAAFEQRHAAEPSAFAPL